MTHGASMHIMRGQGFSWKRLCHVNLTLSLLGFACPMLLEKLTGAISLCKLLFSPKIWLYYSLEEINRIIYLSQCGW